MLLVILAVIIVSLSLIIHYRNHFQPPLCKQRNASNRDCICRPINGEEFNFFPFSFLLYLVFNAILCIIVSITEGVHYYFSTEQTMYTLLFPIHLYTITPNLHPIGSIHIGQREPTIFYALDYILIYCILTLSIWESFFAFYRFYTTREAERTLESVSIYRVFRLFMIYAMVFSALFIIQIHYIYAIFPIIIIINFIFNLYCNWIFTSIIIENFKNIQSQYVCGNALLDHTQQVLKKLYLLRKTLFLCCILQSVSLSAFVVIYDINITHFLPLLWCVSAAVHSTIFARNKMHCTHKCCYTRQKAIIQCPKQTSTVELKTVKVFDARSSKLKSLPSISICSENDVDLGHAGNAVSNPLPSTSTNITLTQSATTMSTKIVMKTSPNIRLTQSEGCMYIAQPSSKSENDRRTTAPPLLTKKNSSKLKIHDLDIPILLDDEACDNYRKNKPKFRDIQSTPEEKKLTPKLSISPRVTMSERPYSPSGPDFVKLQLKPIKTLRDLGFCTKMDVEIFDFQK